jgi:hypothetical protein
MRALDHETDFGSPLSAGEVLLLPLLPSRAFSIILTARRLAREFDCKPVFSLQIAK